MPFIFASILFEARTCDELAKFQRCRNIPATGPGHARRTAAHFQRTPGSAWNLGTISPLPTECEFHAIRGNAMSLLKWALIFLVISLVAALFGFAGISEASADIARVLFYIFVVIFLVLLILGMTIFKKVSG
jgi:uncharacterized membrane protein YtjA (UPF0391 family)